MIYDDKTLERCSDDVLIEHEKKLKNEIVLVSNYWLNSYTDNHIWSEKLISATTCLRNVKAHIMKRNLH